ncbi:MAG: HD domain-containing protein, partial [bacterium]|nr:HD domain-containing protein [bacterium]
IAKEINLALNADRCTVFLLDAEKNELWSKVALGMDLKEIRFDANLGIAGSVVQTGETINIQDAYNDERFNKEIDLQTGYETKSILCMPIRNMSHEIIGAFQVLNKKGGHFTGKDEDLLIAIGSSAGIALENATLFNKQKQLIEEQKQLLSSFIDTLSASIDARDKITAGHSERVTKYAVLICEKLQMNKEEIEIIRQASLLHDIGKIGIKDHILQKEGALTKEEYDEIKQHAKITYDILSKIYLSKYFQDVAKIASSHHEKYDGTGYFLGLKGEEIPLGGRILAVSDVFDAITSKRHYRSKMDILQALDIIVQGSNKHFDKNMVDAFMNLESDKILEVMNGEKIKEQDNFVLSKFKMYDIYGMLKNTEHRKLTTEEELFINTFKQYYN